VNVLSKFNSLFSSKTKSLYLNDHYITFIPEFSDLKKALIAILAFVYITTTTGATVHLHYCMGKLASWNFHHEEKSKCGKCGMNIHDGDSDGCCKDIQKQVKNDTDQKRTEGSFSLNEVLFAAILCQPVILNTVTVSSIVGTTAVSNAPPPGKVPLYLRNRVFRI
jgi:hypothetical protein